MLSPTQSRRLLAAAVVGLTALPLSSHATIIFTPDACNPSDGCDQSVNFTPANAGTTVVGDTNPPSPLYNVFVKSLEGLTLHASGSSVDSGVGGPGLTSVLIYPDAGYAWGAIEFMLDSTDKNQAKGSGGLTFTVIDQFNNSFVFDQSSSTPVTFPHEGNNGENQHYSFHGSAGELITSVQIDYLDPDPVTDPNSGLKVYNTINDVHNIDVNTQLVPEPGSLALIGVGLAGAGLGRRRKNRH